MSDETEPDAFKVGDRVKVRTDEAALAKVRAGEHGRVMGTRLSADGTHTIFEVVMDRTGDEWWFDAGDIERLADGDVEPEPIEDSEDALARELDEALARVANLEAALREARDVIVSARKCGECASLDRSDEADMDRVVARIDVLIADAEVKP